MDTDTRYGSHTEALYLYSSAAFIFHFDEFISQSGVYFDLNMTPLPPCPLRRPRVYQRGTSSPINYWKRVWDNSWLDNECGDKFTLLRYLWLSDYSWKRQKQQLENLRHGPHWASHHWLLLLLLPLLLLLLSK